MVRKEQVQNFKVKQKIYFKEVSKNYKFLIVRKTFIIETFLKMSKVEMF